MRVVIQRVKYAEVIIDGKEKKHESAAQKARDLGLKVVEDRCPKIEHQRLFGELRKVGFATKIVSSRL